MGRPEVGNLAWAVRLWPDSDRGHYWMSRHRGAEPLIRLFQTRGRAMAAAGDELAATTVPWRVERVLVRVRVVYS